MENLVSASITLSRNVLVLALDTTTRAGSVAVVRDGDVLSQLVGDRVADARRAPAAATSCARSTRAGSAARRRSSCWRSPPVRDRSPACVSASRRCRDWRWRSDLRIVPVSVLDALAAAGADGRARSRRGWTRQRGEVFAALYDPAGRRIEHRAAALTARAHARCMGARPSSTRSRALHRRRRRAGTPRSCATRLGRDIEIVEPPPLAPVDRPDRAPRPDRARLAARRRPDLHPPAGCRDRARSGRRLSARHGRRRHHHRADLDDSEDLDAVAALEAASFTNPWTREMLERELRQSDVARVYVLRAAGRRVAAFCACWFVHDELHINTIAVDPALRRRGLARG